ncbi:MAG: hypothetical protein JWQ87_2887 [Candidatus Sulfotelmatobacter sp.]|nr:hypothetical protein [Candidatus Sulfotelmatobacter sp.]
MGVSIREICPIPTVTFLMQIKRPVKQAESARNCRHDDSSSGRAVCLSKMRSSGTTAS